MNLMLARTYLQKTHPECISKTWKDLIEYLIEGLSEEAPRQKWERIKNSWPFLCEAITADPQKPLYPSLLLETRRYFNQGEMISLILAIMAVNDWIYR